MGLILVSTEFDHHRGISCCDILMFNISRVYKLHSNFIKLCWYIYDNQNFQLDELFTFLLLHMVLELT